MAKLLMSESRIFIAVIMAQGRTIRKIRKARRNGKLAVAVTGRDLVRIGIHRGTAWTFLYKHCIDRGKGYETFTKYFRRNADGTYSLLEETDRALA